MSAAVTHRNTPAASGGWLINPWCDLLFLANVAWPLVLLVELTGGLDAHAGVQFWQIYFVTTPHRWITLALVFLDGDRFRQRSGVYLGIAAIVIAFCLTVRVSTGTLTCLLTIDYVWNAWHFAAQHHGIFRIYGRLAEPERTAGLLTEKVAMRAFLVYVAVRVAGWSWALPTLDAWLARADWCVLLVPAWLIARELRHLSRVNLGRLAYVTSVSGVYVGMLGAVHFRRPELLLMLATASALFHATEYLAIVTWTVRRKHGGGNDSRGVLRIFAPRWGLTLAVFMTVLGLGGWMIRLHLLEFWLLLNVIVAYLHYWYDGMIWKVRRPNSFAN